MPSILITNFTTGNTSTGRAATTGLDLGCMFVNRDYFTEGGLWGWGSNSQGGLGNNSTTNVSSPVQTIGSDKSWRCVSGGQNASLGIKIDGTLWTWGFGTNGQLGNNTTTNASSPVQTVSGGTNWRSLARGPSNKTAAIRDLDAD